MNLELEYVCTDTELEEARGLAPQVAIGGGSRWLSRLILLAVSAGLLFGIDLQLRQSLQLPARLCFLAGVAALFIVLRLARRRPKRGPPPPPIRMVVSETDLTFVNDGTRVSIPWSGFARTAETPRLFVLLDRPKQTLVVVPKRTFPDPEALEWFRSRATRLQGSSASRVVAASPAHAPGSPEQVSMVFRLGYSDFLNRSVSSWRTRTILLAVLAPVVVVPLLLTTRKPLAGVADIPANRVATDMLGMFGLVVAVILLRALVAWLSDRKHHGLRRIVLSSDEIRCDDDLERGVIPWSAYAKYMENRWAFFIWDARRLSWHMLPKRAFASVADLDRCRGLLSRRLRPSRWFCM
jgi:hypothetical protein